MKPDQIAEIGIDIEERLYIKPMVVHFTHIYRTATEVHWDEKGLFLYSPKPREWPYFDWYKHIIGVSRDECSCNLLLTESTIWINIDDDLRLEIVNWK